MTKSEALVLILDYCEFNMYQNPSLNFPSFPGEITDIAHNSYLSTLCSDLIKMIGRSRDDPIETVLCYYRDVDYMLGDTRDDNFIAHRYLGFIERELHEIYEYLYHRDSSRVILLSNEEVDA